VRPGVRAVLLVGPLLLIASTMAALTWWNHKRHPMRAGVTAVEAVQLSPRSSPPVSLLLPSASAVKDALPWQARREPRAHHKPGEIPAWIIKPPPPDPASKPPPPPQEPPDPRLHRPPLVNPNGINGDRPQRPVLGLD
jgi:hypothetical protein